MKNYDVEGFPNSARVRIALAEKGASDEVEFCVVDVTAQNTMRYLDSVLAQSDYLAGGEFSMADITAFAGLAFADFAKVDIPAGLSNLTAWRSKVAARPSCGG